MSKNKTPKGEKIQMMCEFKLTDAEKSEKATLAATLAEEAQALEQEKSEATQNFNKQIKAKEDAMFRHLTEVKAGIRKQEVEVTQVLNFDKNVVEFWFNGEINSTREMTEDDRQTTLDVKPSKRKRPLRAVATQLEENDIETVRRQETNSRTKRSSVDAPMADA